MSRTQSFTAKREDGKTVTVLYWTTPRQSHAEFHVEGQSVAEFDHNYGLEDGRGLRSFKDGEAKAVDGSKFYASQFTRNMTGGDDL